MFLNWDLSDVFLMIGLGLWVLGRKMTEVKSHFHYMSRVCSITVTYDVDVDLDHMAEAVFVAVKFLFLSSTYST